MAMVVLEKQGVYELVYSETPECIYIESVYVFKEHRNKGVGTMLIKQVLEKARQRGVPCKLTYTNSKNRRLYRKLGFVDAGKKEMVCMDVQK